MPYFGAMRSPSAVLGCQRRVNTLRSNSGALEAGISSPKDRANRPMATAPAKKVLVVEDNELNMKLFCDLLDAFGFETLVSRDGLKAVDLAREHRPDLIIMDIQLPEVSGL